MNLNLLKSMAITAVALVAFPAMAAGVLDHEYRPLAGKSAVSLNKTYAGDVLLVVNTASKCGFTPQYEGLEALQKQYAARGFNVLGFPSNDFGSQEPGSNKEVANFCRMTYGVQFPMFAKSNVKGAQANPVFGRLIALTGKSPQWNFHKYLISRDGKTVQSFDSAVAPEDKTFQASVERMLTDKAH